MMWHWFRWSNPTLWRCPASGAYHDPAVLWRALAATEVPTTDTIRESLGLPPVTRDGRGFSEEQVDAAYRTFCAYLEAKKNTVSA